MDEAALRRRRKLREERALEEYREAFGDPAYRAEQEELARAFAPADAETARSIEP